MANLSTTPDLLVTAAENVASVKSTISTANAAAAARTSGVVAAAGDEVSAAAAALFNSYARDYQALLAQAAAFPHQFSQALTAAGSAYAQAEATNAAAMSSAVGVLSAPIQTLLGTTPLSAGGPSGVSALTSTVTTSVSGTPLTALIMGGTANPQPTPAYVNEIYSSYIQPRFPQANPLGVFTPEQFWPVTPQLGNLTFGQSVSKGVALLDSAIGGQLTAGNNVLVFGYSQSATIATNEITALMAAGSPHSSQLSFMLIGNPNNPDGGLLERFTGFYIPFLDVAFNGATPPNSPYPTIIYSQQYDGIADAPQYPLNILADLNAFMGYFYVHGSYPTLTAGQISGAVPLATSPGYSGQTQYYEILTQDLPLLDPIRDIPYAGPPIADVFQPDLRVLVDLGYGDIGPGLGYANIPTPATLIEIPNPITIVTDLATGTVQGPYGAAVEIGVEAGLLSPSLYPSTYPWVPSTDPGLNVFIGQPSVTELSVLSGALGSVLKLIPPLT